MERYTSPRTFKTLLLVFLVATSSVSAATYTTLTNGAWNNTTNVWSLDGITPCGCTPGAISGGNDIIVNHAITMSYNLSFNLGSTFQINPSGSLSGTNNITPWNATLNLMGNVSIARFSQGIGTTTILTNGAVMSLTDRFILHGGIFTSDNAMISMPMGNFDITSSTAIMHVINGSKVNISSGNINNDGQLTIDATSCVTTSGNWRNEATGIVSGSGSATSTGGNMGNLGVWDVNIRWCSVGSDFGMPSPEDCASAGAVCGVIVLPIELLNFEAKTIGSQIHLYWTTASERYNDYFLVQRSNDGVLWTDLGMIDGSGNSLQEIDYEFHDITANSGLNYYRLIQVDYNGHRTISEVVSAEISITESELECYPNPVESNGMLHIRNKGNEAGELQLFNLNGTVVYQSLVSGESNAIQLPTIPSGLYLIRWSTTSETKSSRLLIR